MFAILLLSDLFLLLLFARVFTRTDDRASFFNPYLLWARRVTDPVGAFVADLFPGLPVRAACAIAFLFILAFRGALFVSASGANWTVVIGSTLAFHPRAGWFGAIGFSLLDFAVFLVRFWGLALLADLLAAPKTAMPRMGQALDTLASPCGHGPLWARIIGVLLANALLAPLLHHLATVSLAAPGSAHVAFGSLFHVETPARLAAAYLGVALFSLADFLAFLRGALIIAIFASLAAAIFRNRTLATFFLELQNLLLGRFSRRQIGVGMFDFTPILFFVALNFLYGLAVSFVLLPLRHFGVFAAGALAAQSY